MKKRRTPRERTCRGGMLESIVWWGGEKTEQRQECMWVRGWNSPDFSELQLFELDGSNKMNNCTLSGARDTFVGAP